MKATLISATSVSAIALVLVLHGTTQRDISPSSARETNQRSPSSTSPPQQDPVVSTDSPETNRRFISEARQSKQRPQISDAGSAASRPFETPSGNPGLDGRIPKASRITGLSHGSPASGTSFTTATIPSDSIAPTHSPVISTSEGLAADPYQTPQPAALVDMGDLVPPDSIRDAALQDEAERLASVLSEVPSGTAIREEIIADSDHWFRQRYGGWLWMQHHVQAHHLAAAGN